MMSQRYPGASFALYGCVLLVLAGCQSAPVNDLPDGSGATGELGSPMTQSSPADVYIELSAAYLREGQLGEAFRNAQKAVIVDPGSSNAHTMLGLVQQSLGQEAAAEDAYRVAVKRDPRNPVALNAYGSFLCGAQQRRYDEAVPLFQRALDNPLYETPWLALSNSALCRELAGDNVGAERDYRAALRANPRFAPSLLGMAKLSFAAGNYLSSRAYLQRYAEVAAHTAESLWLGVRTERQLGDVNQVASYSLKLRSKFPDSEEAQFLQTIE